MPLGNHGTRQRHHIKQGARLINQRAPDHEAECDQPLPHGAAASCAHPDVERPLDGEESAEGEKRRRGIRPADGPACDHLRRWDQGEQDRETQARAERPAERAQAPETHQRDRAQQQGCGKSHPFETLHAAGLAVRRLQQPAVDRPRMRGAKHHDLAHFFMRLAQNSSNRRAIRSHGKSPANKRSRARETAARSTSRPADLRRCGVRPGPWHVRESRSVARLTVR